MIAAQQLLMHLGVGALRVREAAYEPCGSQPWWLRLFFSPGAAADCWMPTGDSPFLTDFIERAQAHWTRGAATDLLSGPWLEMDAQGQAWPFEARAAVIEGERLLIISQLGDTYYREVDALQLGREKLLENERLEQEVSQRTQQIKRREEELAYRLLNAAGYRDLETGAHVKRIGLYSAAMAAALGWRPLQVEDIRIAAPMHDLGKIGIPDRILLKPGRLDRNEFAIMQTHAELGGKMLSGSHIPMIQLAKDIAWCHHEKWNGMGYPRGLQGAAIPEAARIVAVVDVFDAMIHKRVYKDPIPEFETSRFIREQAGAHFDPSMIEVFFDIFDEIRTIKETVREEY